MELSIEELKRALADKDELYRRELGRRREFQRLLIEKTGFDADTPQPDFMPVRIKRSLQPRCTFLVCGSMRGGNSISGLEFQGTLGQIDCEQVYIKDFERIWYQNGLMGMTSSRAETIDFLRVLLEDFPRPLTVIGASSGGYAAVLFGHALDADRIVTFGAQTLINRNVVNTYGNLARSGQQYRFNSADNDLRRILTAKPPAGQIEMHYAGKNMLDRRQHKHLAGLQNVTLVPHDARPHNIAIRLRARGELKDILIAESDVSSDSGRSRQANSEESLQ